LFFNSVGDNVTVLFETTRWFVAIQLLKKKESKVLCFGFILDLKNGINRLSFK